MSNYNVTFRPGKKNDNWVYAFEQIEPSTKVLDVGCSKGYFGEALTKSKGCLVEGVEPDEGDASIAAARLKKVYNSTLEEALNSDLKGKKYDHIVFLDVIEHLYRPVEALKAIKKLLKPGGSVVFSIPNMSHLSVRLMVMNGDFEYGQTGILDNTHMHFYTEQEIQRIFKEAGYRISNLDGVVVRYDDKTLISQLRRIGIKPDVQIMRILRSKNGEIYQLVGAATQGRTSTPTRPFSSPNPKAVADEVFKEELASRTSKIVKENNRLSKKLKEKQEAIERRNTEIATLREELANKKGVLAGKIFPRRKSR
jgi:2-polyprenyl-3-methyl-5-hydroxy-6-metoxy-1,4-benzoquinol methylase